MTHPQGTPDTLVRLRVPVPLQPPSSGRHGAHTKRAEVSPTAKGACTSRVRHSTGHHTAVLSRPDGAGGADSDQGHGQVRMQPRHTLPKRRQVPPTTKRASERASEPQSALGFPTPCPAVASRALCCGPGLLCPSPPPPSFLPPPWASSILSWPLRSLRARPSGRARGLP